MTIVANTKLQEAFSLALEDRSRGYADLVSNNNAILYVMKRKGQFKSFSGPTIRERLLYNEAGTYTRYNGYQTLNPAPAELFSDAEFEPKMAAVSVTLSNEEILKNAGRNQLRSILEDHITAGEQELVDRFVEDVHSAGTASKQIGGLQALIPTDPTTGTVGGIDRSAVSQWQTNAYDVDTDDILGDGTTTQINSTSIQPIFNTIMALHQRSKSAANIILSSRQHFITYSQAVTAIQRIQDENELGKLGFANLKFYGSGKSVDVVLEGGVGSAMPDNVTYFIEVGSIKFRYHPSRNFTSFGGRQMPVNQDAIVQHIGWMGNLTINNGLFNTKLYDTDTAS